MFEYARCDWKDRRGTPCDQRAVAIRDLGPAYRGLRLQYVCKHHIHQAALPLNPMTFTRRA